MKAIKAWKKALLSKNSVFRNEHGALDLASIMVGVVVLGLIGGVVSATVFAVIPWSQDNAAKQQLDSIVSAQQAYRGMSSDPSQATSDNTYASLYQLETAGLLKGDDKYCTTGNSENFAAYSISSTGAIWKVTADNTRPEITTEIPSACGYLKGIGSYKVMPRLTHLTYKCDRDLVGRIPMRSFMYGTETWSDGMKRTYDNADVAEPRTFEAGVEYTVSFVGTYKVMRATLEDPEIIALNTCLRSVNHWGEETGVTEGTSAFYKAANLTDIPDSVPSTIRSFYHMFAYTNMNDPDISKWDMSNATATRGMFRNNPAFNQPLNDWNLSNVTLGQNMFTEATAFNQPLDKWDTSAMRDMSGMFYNATSFNQDISNWDTRSMILGTEFASPSFPDAYMPPRVTKDSPPV